MQKQSLNSTGQTQIWTLMFTGIIFISFAIAICSQGSTTALPVYLSAIGARESLGGLQASLFSLSAGVARLLSGSIADSHSRRGVILCGTSIFVLSCVLPLLSNSITALLISRTIQGFGFSLATTAAAAAASEVLPPARLGEGMGYFALGQSLSLALGPMCAIMLLSSNNLSLLYLAMCGIGAAALVVAWRCRYEDAEQIAARAAACPRGFWQRTIETRSILPAVLQFGVILAQSSLTAFGAVYAVMLGLEQPGLLYTFAAVSMVACRLFAGRLIDRRPPLQLLLISVLLIGGALFLLAICHSMTVFCLAGICYGLGAGMTQPLLNSLAVRRSDPTRFGAANATYYLSCDLGFGLGSAMWGIIIEHIGYSNSYFSSLSLLLMVAILGIITLRREPAPCESISSAAQDDQSTSSGR